MLRVSTVKLKSQKTCCKTKDEASNRLSLKECFSACNINETLSTKTTHQQIKQVNN